MTEKVMVDTKEYKDNGIESLRKLTFSELASMLHGLLFAYEKVFINLYGDDARKLYPYIIEEMSNLLHTGDNPIIDKNRSLEENIDRIIYFISNEEYLKDIVFEEMENGKFVFTIGTCSFAKSGVHEILKIKDGMCPFALIIASCLTELASDGHVKIAKSEFDDDGSKTYMEMITGGKGEWGKALDPYSRIDDEIFETPEFKATLDDLDLRIIKALRKDGRKANVDLSKDLGASESTVRRRINSLIQKGVIRGFTTLLRYPPGDTFMRAFIAIKVDPRHMESVAERLSKMKETCSVYKAIGKHNLICETLFSNRASFQEFIDELHYVEGVIELDYSIGSSAPKPCPWYGF